MSNTYIVIPARFGSSRLEGKPLLEINDKPIFWHVYQRCIEAGIPSSHIFLATDHQDVYSKAEELDISAVMTSKYHESGTDRIHEVALQKKWNSDDLVINVQGDEPLIPHELISQLAEFARANHQFSISTAIADIQSQEDFENINVVKAIMGENGRAVYFTRSAAPLNRDNISDLTMSCRHIGIYVYKVSALIEFCSFPESPLEQYEKLEQLRALSNGMKLGATKYSGNLSHGVDTLEDYQAIKERMENN